MSLVDREQSRFWTASVCYLDCSRYPLSWVVCISWSKKRDFFNPFSEGRLQPIQAVVQVELCIVAEWVCGLETPSLVLKSYCRVVSLSSP